MQAAPPNTKQIVTWDYKIHFLLNIVYVSLGMYSPGILPQVSPSTLSGGLPVQTVHGCTHCIKIAQMWKGVAFFLKLFPSHGTALAHGHRTHSFLNVEGLKIPSWTWCLLTVYQPKKNRISTPADQNIKSKNMKHPKRACKFILWHLDLIVVLDSVWQEACPSFKIVPDYFPQVMCLPHSKLFLKSISICFLGTKVSFLFTTWSLIVFFG